VAWGREGEARQARCSQPSGIKSGGMRQRGGIIGSVDEVWQWFAKSDTRLAALSAIMLWQGVFLVPAILFSGMALLPTEVGTAFYDFVWRTTALALATDYLVAIVGAGIGAFVVWRALRRRKTR
jgi:hypothetical protein